MTNKEIRKRAWELCRENFKLLLGAAFLQSLILSVAVNIQTQTDYPILASLISLCLMVLSTLLQLGMIRFILDIWHNNPTSLSALMSQKHRFWTYVRCNLLLLPCIVGIFVGLTLTLMLIAAISEIVAIIALVAVAVLLVWLIIRIEMSLTCIVLRPSFGARDCIRAAWRASKGNVGRLFCNAFVLNLPMAIAQGLVGCYLLYLMLSGQVLNTIGTILLDFASIMISTLLRGYIQLGTYALHEQLLEKHFRTAPVLSAAELWNTTDDEYEDIPEEENSDNNR